MPMLVWYDRRIGKITAWKIAHWIDLAYMEVAH